MDDAVNFRVRGENLVEVIFVGNVTLMEDRSLAADEFNAVYSDLGGVVETIDDDNIVAVLQKCKRRERANVASATTSHVVVSRVFLSPLRRRRGAPLRRTMAGRPARASNSMSQFYADKRPYMNNGRMRGFGEGCRLRSRPARLTGDVSNLPSNEDSSNGHVDAMSILDAIVCGAGMRFEGRMNARG